MLHILIDCMAESRSIFWLAVPESFNQRPIRSEAQILGCLQDRTTTGQQRGSAASQLNSNKDIDNTAKHRRQYHQENAPHRFSNAQKIGEFRSLENNLLALNIVTIRATSYEIWSILAWCVVVLIRQMEWCVQCNVQYNAEECTVQCTVQF